MNTFRIILVASTCLAVAPSAHAAKTTQTVKLLKDAPVYSVPGGTGKALTTISAVRPLTKTPTVLPVISSVNTDKGKWVRVRLPKRPNGSTGWIAAGSTQQGTTSWKITVKRSTRVATVTKKGRTVKSFRVVIGAGRTPTPAGNFFVAETVRQPRGSILGPYVLALSAYSNVLQEFNGGPGQIGLHGRTGLSDPLGSAASYGCVRFSDSTIVWLAARVKPGSPVEIR